MIKGNSKEKINVRTGMGGGDCGYIFRDNVEYLVYAYKKDNLFTTSICTRTRPLHEAITDLAFFNKLPSILSRSSLVGTINYSRDENPDRILAGVNITIQNDKSSYTTITNKEGIFFFDGVKPGQYTVNLDIGDSLYFPSYLRNIRIDTSECMEEIIRLNPNTFISGKVRYPNGKKLKDIDISLVPVDSFKRANSHGYFDEATSNYLGYFEFNRGVRLGEYYLVINPNGPSVEQPYPTIYYPGTLSVLKAEKIRIKSATTHKKLTFVIPPKKASLFTISGQCFFKNNISAKNVTISFSINKGYRRTDYLDVKTNNEGRFSFKAVQGQEIWVDGYNFELKVSKSIESNLLSKQKYINRSFGISTWPNDTLRIVKPIPDLKLTIDRSSYEVSNELKKLEKQNEQNRD